MDSTSPGSEISRNPGPIRTRFYYFSENQDYLERNWASEKSKISDRFGSIGPIDEFWTGPGLDDHLEKPAEEYHLNIIILKSFEVVILSFFYAF